MSFGLNESGYDFFDDDDFTLDEDLPFEVSEFCRLVAVSSASVALSQAFKSITEKMVNKAIHFTDEKTDAERGKRVCPRSPR